MSEKGRMFGDMPNISTLRRALFRQPRQDDTEVPGRRLGYGGDF
jgi:hypothetical protein